MRRWLIALCVFCASGGLHADEVAELKIQLAIAEARGMRLAAQLEALPAERDDTPAESDDPEPLAKLRASKEKLLRIRQERIEATVVEQPRYEMRAVTKYRSETRTQCTVDRWGRKTCRRVTVQVPYTVQERVLVESNVTTQESAEAYATPLDAAKRMLDYMRSSTPKTLLDLGSGDGRMVVEWSRFLGYPAIGIERDPERVAISRAWARERGVAHLAKFIQGDYTQMADLPAADVVYIYQFPEDLAVIRDRITRYDQIVSYAHEIPGLLMASHNGGEFFSWRKPAIHSQPATIPQPVGVWYSGKFYTRDNVPHNGRCNCAMCRWIKNELRKLGAYP